MTLREAVIKEARALLQWHCQHNINENEYGPRDPKCEACRFCQYSALCKRIDALAAALEDDGVVVEAYMAGDIEMNGLRFIRLNDPRTGAALEWEIGTRLRIEVIDD